MDMPFNFNTQEIYFLSYLIFINVLTFIIFFMDKSKAKTKMWRIPEYILITVSLLGGGIGALMSMVIFKHKLSKKKFYIGIPSIIVLNKTIEFFIFNKIR